MTEQEHKKVKLQTIYGKVLTIDISKQTETHIYGTDLYGNPVVVRMDNIDSMVPCPGSGSQPFEKTTEK